MTETERRLSVALLAIWELWENNDLTPHYASDTAMGVMERIEMEVINPIYSEPGSTGLLLDLDTFQKGGDI